MELASKYRRWCLGFSGYMTDGVHQIPRQIMFLLTSSIFAIIASAILLAIPVHASPVAQSTTIDSEIQTVVIETTVGVIENWRLRLYCIIGALGGGWLSVWMFPPPKDGIRPFAGKFSCSAIASIMFSPALMRKFGIPLDPDFILAASGCFGLVAWALIQLGVPLILRIFMRRGAEWGGVTDNDPKL